MTDSVTMSGVADAPISAKVAKSLYGVDLENTQNHTRLPILRRLAPLSTQASAPAARPLASTKAPKRRSFTSTPITLGQAVRVVIVLAIGWSLSPAMLAPPTLQGATLSSNPAG